MLFLLFLLHFLQVNFELSCKNLINYILWLFDLRFQFFYFTLYGDYLIHNLILLRLRYGGKFYFFKMVQHLSSG